MELNVANRLSTLGHPKRLALFRLLMRRYPDKVPATELAQALDLKPNTLSTYVNALMHADLVVQRREGKSRRYSINLETARETFDYLLLDCCRGRPDICSPSTPGLQLTPPYRVLFLCTGNSARSIFAEAILRMEAGAEFAAFSAGTNPAAAIHPLARDVLHARGHDLTGLAPKNISAWQEDKARPFDLVITVCDKAANEDCPAWPHPTVTAHWGAPDPADVLGTPDERKLAFARTYGALRSRIVKLVSLRIATLDRLALQQALDDIGRTPTRLPA